MKKRLIVCLLIISSCTIKRNKNQESKSGNDNSNDSQIINYFLASEQNIKENANVKFYSVGESYKTKVFLNSNGLYSIYNVKPKFYFKNGEDDDTTTTYKLLQLLGDTGYVDFIIRDKFIKAGEEKINSWSVKMVIPLPKNDTIFKLTQDYIYKK